MRLKLLAIFISFLSLASHDAYCMQINGNHLYTNKELTGLINLNAPVDSVENKIELLYKDAGYFNARVGQISANQNGEKAITIVEGQPARVDNIQVELVPPLNTINYYDIGLAIKRQIASKIRFDEFGNQCIRRLAESGMPFANGQWRDFQFDSLGNLTATFKIMTGPTTRIAGFRYNGVKRTRPAVLEKMADLKIGENYSETRVINSEHLLDEMPYLEIKAPFEIQPLADGDSCLVIYNIKELPSTRFDGAGGLIRLKNKSTFVGRLDLEFGDIFGTGHSFGFLWNKKDKYSSEIRLNYLEPFILNSRFDMRLEAFQLDRDTSFIETGGSVGFTHAFGEGLNGSLYLTLQRTEPEPQSNVASSNGRAVRVEFDYERTDHRENPRRGYGIASEVNYKNRTNRNIGPDSLSLPTKLTSAGVNLRYFLKITGRFVTAFRLSGWGIVANDGIAPLDELRFLGGFDNLRGYSTDRFPAYRYGMATVEPRLLAGKDGRIYLFTDIAAIKSSQDGNSDYHYFPGYGLGLAAPSTLGLFKVEVGWGKSGFPSEPVFNFGVAGRF
jgi:outer membrane protein assembly factor BamA